MVTTFVVTYKGMKLHDEKKKKEKKREKKNESTKKEKEKENLINRKGKLS